MQDFAGRVAVITGGASGIGLAVARALGGRGMKLVIADIEAAALDRAVARLTEAGFQATGKLTDVGDRAAVEALADEVEHIGTIADVIGEIAARSQKPASISSMGGIGGILIRGIMKSKNVPALEEMMASAIQGGVKIIACQMSMELMGIRREELIDGIEVGGVASYLEASEQADNNLFI